MKVTAPVWSVEQIVTLVDHLPVMIAYWDRSVRNVFANQAYAEWFGGRPLSEIRGRHARDLLGPEGWAHAWPVVQATLAGQTQQYDRALEDAHGNTRHIHTVYIPNVVNGVVEGFYTLGTDITDRVTAQAVERESAEQVATFIERERIADELHDEVIQRLFAVVLDLAKPSGPRVRAAADAIQNVIGDLRAITSPAEAARPASDDGSAVPSWTATELVAILDRIPANVGYVDNDFRVRFVNRASSDYFGRTRTEIVGTHARDLFGAEAYAMNLPYMQAAVAGQVQRFDGTLVNDRGQTRHSQTTYLPNIVRGAVEGFFVLAIDISDRVRVEAELRESVERIAVLDERRQAAADLHDVVIQRLHAVAKDIQALHRSPDVDDVGRLTVIAECIDDAILELRISRRYLKQDQNPQT